MHVYQLKSNRTKGTHNDGKPPAPQGRTFLQLAASGRQPNGPPPGDRVSPKYCIAPGQSCDANVDRA
jgi:hypothetical protein